MSEGQIQALLKSVAAFSAEQKVTLLTIERKLNKWKRRVKLRENLGAIEDSGSSSSSESEDDLEDFIEADEDLDFKSNRIIPADHVTEAEAVEIHDPPPDQTWVCDICQTTYTSKLNYTLHCRNIHNDGEWECDLCAGMFRKDKQLRR